MAKGAKPFEGAACEKRLKEWIQFLELTDYEIVNQVDLTYMPLYDLVELVCKRYIKVIALGNNASKALCKLPILGVDLYHFKLPHPSFRNRKLNSKEYEVEQLEKCKAGLNEIS